MSFHFIQNIVTVNDLKLSYVSKIIIFIYRCGCTAERTDHISGATYHPLSKKMKDSVFELICCLYFNIRCL